MKLLDYYHSISKDEIKSISTTAKINSIGEAQTQVLASASTVINFKSAQSFGRTMVLAMGSMLKFINNNYPPNVMKMFSDTVDLNL